MIATPATTSMLAPLKAKLEINRLRRSLPAPTRRRQLREGAGLSQADLAALLGVSRVTISRWESGVREPDAALLHQYRAVLWELEQVEIGVGA